MPLTKQKEGFFRANMVITGNNLVVNTSAGAIDGGIYITPSSGTTNNYLLNGSDAVLNNQPTKVGGFTHKCVRLKVAM